MNSYDLGGRILRDTAVMPVNDRDYDTYNYDANGRTRYRYTRTSNSGQGIYENRQEAHYYDGNNRLAVLERHSGEAQQASLPNDPQPLIETYRYDALGRRVLTHTLHELSCTIAGCESAVQRTVWDGNQVLYEIRAPASAATAESAVENDARAGDGESGVVNGRGRART